MCTSLESEDLLVAQNIEIIELRRDSSENSKRLKPGKRCVIISAYVHKESEMTIEADFLHKMIRTNPDNVHSMDFVLNLDLLNGCVHLCDGCFVNKTKVVKNWEDVLENALQIATELSQKGMRFREVILGPTDFFSATNTAQILRHKTFQKLLSIHEKTRITASSVFEGIDKSHFLELFSILDSTANYRQKMILEFLVPLNTAKMVERNEQYIADNKWVLNFFKEKTPKLIDWSYVININNNQLLQDNFHVVTDMIKSEFNTILEFNPGFFRSNNNKVIDKNLSYWKGFLQNTLAGRDVNQIHASNLAAANVDKLHNTVNTICLNLIEGGVYFSPFIYEQIIDTSEQFKISNFDGAHIISRHLELQQRGYDYALKTKECADCGHLTACVGRNVLNFMEDNQKVECLFPEVFKEMA